jgi:O-antigen/teichoic acid export membrane protein
LSSALFALAGLWVMLRASGFFFDWALALSSFSLSGPLAANQLLNWVMNLSDRTILNRHFDHATVAIYSMGYQFGFILTYVDLAFFTAFSPMFYKRSITHGDGPQLVTRFAPYLFVLSCSIAAVLAGCSRELILVFSTPEYLPSRQVILVVAAAYAVNELFTFAGPIAVLQRKPTRVTIISFLSAGVNLGLNLWLIPIYGYMAAAWNTMAALGIGTLVGYLLTKASYPLRLPWLRIGKAALAATVAGASGWFISFDPPVLALLLKLVLLPSIITLLLLVTGFLSEAERQAALRRLGRLFGTAGRALG